LVAVVISIVNFVEVFVEGAIVKVVVSSSTVVFDVIILVGDVDIVVVASSSTTAVDVNIGVVTTMWSASMATLPAAASASPP